MNARTEALAAAFVARTLPKPQWTHDAHLRVGLWHVVHHGQEEALQLLRLRIRRLNASHGVANDDNGGYHETITRFYVQAIAGFVSESAPGEGLDALADRLVAALGARDLALRHWSRGTLMSTQARRGWVEPDLEPLA